MLPAWPSDRLPSAATEPFFIGFQLSQQLLFIRHAAHDPHGQNTDKTGNEIIVAPNLMHIHWKWRRTSAAWYTSSISWLPSADCYPYPAASSWQSDWWRLLHWRADRTDSGGYPAMGCWCSSWSDHHKKKGHLPTGNSADGANSIRNKENSAMNTGVWSSIGKQPPIGLTPYWL